MSDTVDRIDETLSFYSAGIGGQLEVPVEKDPLAEAWLCFHEFATTLFTAVQSAADEFSRRLQAVLPALQPLRDAAARHQRVLRVYRRWNQPLLRHDMHGYKTRPRRRVRDDFRSVLVPDPIGPGMHQVAEEYVGDLPPVEPGPPLRRAVRKPTTRAEAGEMHGKR